MLQRQGFSKYNAVFEFPYEIQGQRVQMAVTSVTGHLMELDFEPSYR
jgi:DNA topoisomerase-3